MLTGTGCSDHLMLVGDHDGHLRKMEQVLEASSHSPAFSVTEPIRIIRIERRTFIGMPFLYYFLS
jgi:hypothetical protein